MGRPPGFRPIRGRPWRWPSGFHYRRWRRGLFLPAVFMGAAFTFTDWSLMGLPPPPPGTRWVRYGPDLLLVERGTRRILDVIYDAFF